MPQLKASVSVRDLDGLDAAVSEIMTAIDQDLESVADHVLSEAETTTAFYDKIGNLRKKIQLKKSKFEDGGYIVQARAPHAHLVEFGHVMYIHGKSTGKRVPPHPFLRPALAKGIIYAVNKLRGMQS